MDKNSELLQSWKEISQYLERDIRTLLRWRNNLGLPVHRFDENSPRSKVFAYKSELDSWLENKAKTKGTRTKIVAIGKPWAIGLTAATLILAVAFAYVLFFKSSLSRSGPPQLTVLVVPFEDLNPSTQDDYFTVGFTNEITKELADHNLFQVIRREKPVQYSEEAVLLSSRDDGSGPDYELRGQAGIFDDAVRIRISLTRLSDGTVIFDKDYENALTELALVQENISTGIFRELVSEIETEGYRAFLGSASGTAAGEEDIPEHVQIIQSLESETDKWKLYFMGRNLWKVSTQELNETAIDIFHRVCEIDPDLALAYIGLADCYFNYVNFNWDNNLSWILNAEDMLARAYGINPDLPEYYSTSAKIKMIRDLGFGEDTLEEAFLLAEAGLAKYPDFFDLNSIMGFCHFARFGKQGDDADLEKAREYKEKAFWIDSYNILNVSYAEILLLCEEFEKAVEVCQGLIPLDKTNLAEILLGQVYYYMGSLEQCEDIFAIYRDSPKFEDRATASAFLGMIAARRGNTEKALRLAERVETYASGPYGDGLRLASIYYCLGDREHGKVHLRNYFERVTPNRMKYVEQRYIELDKNFSGAVDELETIF